MANIEKVIKWLDICKTSHYAVGINEDYPCRLCPYHEKQFCMKELISDALKLLKEHKQIVRCNDCKFIDESVKTRFFCGRLMRCVDADWFCADGEKKDG